MDQLIQQTAIPKFILCFTGVIVLSSIYFKSKNRLHRSNENRLSSVGWMTIVVGNWAIMDFLMIFFYDHEWYWMHRVYISTLNNSLLLFSLYYFDFEENSFIKKLMSNTYQWKIRVLFFSLVITTTIVILQLLGHEALIYFIPDNLYNVIVVYFLGKGVKVSFTIRGLRGVSYLGYLPILLIVYLIIPFDLFQNEFSKQLSELQISLIIPIYIIFILIFISISILWMNEGFNFSSAKSNYLDIVGEVKNRKHLINIMVHGYIPLTKVWLSKANYTLISNLATKRIKGINDGWVVLESEKEDQYYFHKQFSRVSKELNLPISELFENDRSGRYRLNCLPQHIKLRTKK